jgi:hypothetical protein
MYVRKKLRELIAKESSAKSISTYRETTGNLKVRMIRKDEISCDLSTP